ncbi:MAG: cobaltochelatase CobT-related protein, partial [Phycisphaerales bacterium]
NPLYPLSYKQEKEMEFRDTEVALLIDNSGSMRGRPITLAAPSSWPCTDGRWSSAGRRSRVGTRTVRGSPCTAPAAPARDELQDRHRVYPGDGVLPLQQVLRDLRQTGFTGCVSLELYNEEYWKQDPMTVARTGLEKTLAVIRSACA